MWKLKRKQRPLSHKGEAAAQGIANRIIKLQLRISGYLARKTQYWNTSSKLIALILFCLLFGGASLWLLIRSIY
ncbi:hypothetical protein BDD43_0067 [Mucilaginibacter gracilis]|uniref:Uncharacterized protein n=1 Tax=Mucilaginibacter gracilis TaxID=423350 RepID=A0A495IUK3_9SPHI|nr:hypothetical protein [Mucilaginibacter gracilis]RKR79981.1 hypothetical protein BDD43_0067 [Mucilaginibacter gracilis]